MKSNTSTIIKDYTFILIGICLIVFLFFKNCNNKIPKLDSIPLTIYKTDTLYKKDTIIQIVNKTKFITKIIYIDSSDINIPIDTLKYTREYSDTTSDSVQTIFTKIKTEGILKELNISYKLVQSPIKYIEKTITKTNTIVEPNKFSIYTGLELGGNTTSFNLSPFISLNTQKGCLSYNYNIIQKTHNIGLGFNIFKSKK